MVLKVTHAKVSGVANPADPGLVGGADWDADHGVDIENPLAPPDDGDVLTFRTATGLGFEPPDTSGALPPVGPDGEVLTVVAGAPAWAAPAAGGGGSSGLATQTITLGPGGDFTTMASLLAHLKTNGIAPGALITVSLLVGAITDAGPTTDMRFAQADQVAITGTPAAVFLQEIANVAAAGARWTMDVTFNDASSIAVGDHIVVYANETSNAEVRKLVGVLKATAKVGNVVSVQTYAAQTIPSAVSGQFVFCQVMRTIFNKPLVNVSGYRNLDGFGVEGDAPGGITAVGAVAQWGVMSVYRSTADTTNGHFRATGGSNVSAQIFTAGGGYGLRVDGGSTVVFSGGVCGDAGIVADGLSRALMDTTNSARGVRAKNTGVAATNGSFTVTPAGAVSATTALSPAESLTTLSSDGSQNVAKS